VEPVQPNFGIRIKKLRFDRDMGQQELADLCELSVDQISNIERGKSWTGEVSLALLANAFKVPQTALLDYSENQAFIEGGGLTWRASRKKNTLTVRNRQVEISVSTKKARRS
jgi:transcriptional regulator with XRE-family HTH domain